MNTLDFTPVPSRLIFSKLQTWLILFSVKTGTVLDLRNCSINAFISQNDVLIKRLKEGAGIITSSNGQSFELKNDLIVINSIDTNPSFDSIATGTFTLDVVLTDSNGIDHSIANFVVEVKASPIDSTDRVTAINAFEFDLKTFSYSLTISAAEFAQRAETAKEDAETAKELTIAAKTEVLAAKEIAVAKANEVNTLGFLGVWNASTNTPTLTTTPSNSLADGSFYLVETAGTQTITGSSTDFNEGDQVRKIGASWKRIVNTENKYPFASTVTPDSILKNAIIDVELIGRSPEKHYTIGILKKNVNESGVLVTAILIYEWINGSFGVQSCTFSANNYTPTNNIERVKLTESTTGIYFYLTLDWSKIPDGTLQLGNTFALAGLSQYCIKGFDNYISNKMLDNTVKHKNYPFASTITPNADFQKAVKDVRVYCDDMIKQFCISSIRKNVNGLYRVGVSESISGVLGTEFFFEKQDYTPTYNCEVITVLSPSAKFEITIDWSLLIPVFDLTVQPFSATGISELCKQKWSKDTKKSIVAGLGDSRIDQNDADLAGSYNALGSGYKLNQGFITWGQILSDRNFETIGYNFGVSGETSTQILSRIDAVLNINPEVCIVWAGMNDISQNVSIGTITANMQKIYEKLLKKGIKVIAVLDNFATNFTNAQFLANHQLNDFIRLYVAGKENIYLIDADTVVSDPTQETPTAKSQILYDTTHIGVRGAYYLGKQLAEVLNRILPYKRIKSVGARDSYNINTNPNQLISNTGFSGTGGVLGARCTGIAPTSWKLGVDGTQSSVISSVTTSSEGFPQLQVDATFTQSTDSFSAYQEVETSRMEANKYYKLEAEIEVVNPIALRSIALTLDTNIISTSYTKSCGADAGVSTTGSLNESFIGYFECPIFLSPGNVSPTNWLLVIAKGISNGAGSTSIRIRKIRLTKI